MIWDYKYILQISNLTLFYTDAPVFKEGNYDKEVTTGANVTFECSAEGNPPPMIRWNYISAENVWMTTRGRQTNISVIEATSTNAGVYNCVATNKVGSVTRSVTLRVKGIIIDCAEHLQKYIQ